MPYSSVPAPEPTETPESGARGGVLPRGGWLLAVALILALLGALAVTLVAHRAERAADAETRSISTARDAVLVATALAYPFDEDLVARHEVLVEGVGEGCRDQNRRRARLRSSGSRRPPPAAGATTSPPGPEQSEDDGESAHPPRGEHARGSVAQVRVRRNGHGQRAGGSPRIYRHSRRRPQSIL